MPTAKYTAQTVEFLFGTSRAALLQISSPLSTSESKAWLSAQNVDAKLAKVGRSMPQALKNTLYFYPFQKLCLIALSLSALHFCASAASLRARFALLCACSASLRSRKTSSRSRSIWARNPSMCLNKSRRYRGSFQEGEVKATSRANSVASCQCQPEPPYS